jgi:hypothetical protein
MIRSELEKRNKKIIEAYKKGEIPRMLAARTGLSTQQINNILNRLIPDRNKRLDK